MHILAAILDPADNGFDISDLSVLLGVILLVWGAVYGAVRWNAKRAAVLRTRERQEMETRIKAVVEDLAVKVQPQNGGRGWGDVHTKLDTVITRQGEVVEDVRYLRTRLDHHIDTDHEKG